jgi:hypothetical protein
MTPSPLITSPVTNSLLGIQSRRLGHSLGIPTDTSDERYSGGTKRHRYPNDRPGMLLFAEPEEK